MKAIYSRYRDGSEGVMTITAKEGNAKDIAHMERVISFLVEEWGYEDSVQEGDNEVTLGIGSDTIADAKWKYAQAKKSTK